MSANEGFPAPGNRALPYVSVQSWGQYRAETVSAADVDDAIAIGDELVKTLTPAIDQLLRPPS